MRKTYKRTVQVFGVLNFANSHQSLAWLMGSVAVYEVYLGFVEFHSSLLLPMDTPRAMRRAGRAMIVTFLVYAMLVAAHLGEFWPFSIYPMFSKGGNPWSRSVVRVVDTDSLANWQSYSANDLPGIAYPLLEHGVDPIDLSNFVSKTKTWSLERVEGLRDMFYADNLDQTLLVMRVNGRITEADSVVVEFVPYALINRSGASLNPGLN